jgi:hypothetical protein
VARRSGQTGALLHKEGLVPDRHPAQLFLCRLRYNFKEHRVGPQVQVGLLMDQDRIPREVHLFEGKKAEALTLQTFQHGAGSPTWWWSPMRACFRRRT